jgi:hypothetical protein
MYAYRPPHTRAGHRRDRYVGTGDRIMIMIGLAALVAIVVSGFVTHGQSVLTALNIAFGLKH